MLIKKNTNTKYILNTYGKISDNQGDTRTLSKTSSRTSESQGQGGTSRLENITARQQAERLGSMEDMGIENNTRRYACRYSRLTWIQKLMTLESVTMASVLLFIIMILYYLFFPFQPVVLLKNPIPVVQEKVKAGESVSLLIHFDKKMNIVPEIKYYLVDGFVLELSQASVSRSVGENTVTREILIPPTSTKGTRKIRIELEYRINFMRVVNYSWDSEEFEVI